MTRTYSENKNNRGRPRLPTDGVDVETIRSRQYSRDYQARAYREADSVYQWARAAYNAAHRRAQDAGVKFDLTLEQIVQLARQTTTCPVTGEDLEYGRHGGLRANSASLDRHNPALGYTINNVSVISHWANAARRRLSLTECIQLGIYSAKHLTARYERDNQIITALDDAIDALSNAAGYFADRTRLN